MDITTYVQKHWRIHPEIVKKLDELLLVERKKRVTSVSETMLVNELLAKHFKI